MARCGKYCCRGIYFLKYYGGGGGGGGEWLLCEKMKTEGVGKKMKKGREKGKRKNNLKSA